MADRHPRRRRTENDDDTPAQPNRPRRRPRANTADGTDETPPPQRPQRRRDDDEAPAPRRRPHRREPSPEPEPDLDWDSEDDDPDFVAPRHPTASEVEGGEGASEQTVRPSSPPSPSLPQAHLQPTWRPEPAPLDPPPFQMNFPAVELNPRNPAEMDLIIEHAFGPKKSIVGRLPSAGIREQEMRRNLRRDLNPGWGTSLVRGWSKKVRQVGKGVGGAGEGVGTSGGPGPARVAGGRGAGGRWNEPARQSGVEDHSDDVAGTEDAFQRAQRESELAARAAQRAQAEQEEMGMRELNRAMQASRLETQRRAAEPDEDDVLSRIMRESEEAHRNEQWERERRQEREEEDVIRRIERESMELEAVAEERRRQVRDEQERLRREYGGDVVGETPARPGIGSSSRERQAPLRISTETPPARTPSDRRADTRPRVSSPLSSRPVVTSPSGLLPSPREPMSLDQQIGVTVQRPSRPRSSSNGTRPQPEPARPRAATSPSSSAADRPRGDVARSQSSRQPPRTQPTGPSSEASAPRGNISRSSSACPCLPSGAVAPFPRMPQTSGDDPSRRQPSPASSSSRPSSSGPSRPQVQRSASSRVQEQAREALSRSHSARSPSSPQSAPRPLSTSRSSSSTSHPSSSSTLSIPPHTLTTSLLASLRAEAIRILQHAPEDSPAYARALASITASEDSPPLDLQDTGIDENLRPPTYSEIHSPGHRTVAQPWKYGTTSLAEDSGGRQRRLTRADFAKIKALREVWAALPQGMPARQAKMGGSALQEAMAAAEVEVQESVAETLRVTRGQEGARAQPRRAEGQAQERLERVERARVQERTRMDETFAPVREGRGRGRGERGGRRG